MKNRPSGFGIDELPRIVRGQGSYLFDAAGKRYLDGSGGPAVFCVGCSGNVDGTAGDTIIIAPPYNASDGELEEIVVKLARAVDDALSSA